MGTESVRTTLRVNDVCKKFSVSRRTVYNWMVANKIEYVRLASGTRRIYEDSLTRQGNSVQYQASHPQDAV